MTWYRLMMTCALIELRSQAVSRTSLTANYGPPDVLQLKEVDKPVPKDDEVLIRVQAAEATKADIEMRSILSDSQEFGRETRC